MLDQAAKLVDRYNLQARILPVAIAYLPVGLLIACFLPMQNSIASSGIGAVMVILVAIVFSHTVRGKGQDLQEKLFERWGGVPSVKMLSFVDDALSDGTTERIHAKLNELDSTLGLPTSRDSEYIMGQEQAESRYQLANEFLREHTRKHNDYPLVFAELTSYGFRRNLLALRPLGIFLSVLSLLATLVQSTWTYLDTTQVATVSAISVFISAILFVLWCKCINECFVKRGAQDYSRALLRSVLDKAS